jgi:hypothetical protein
VVPLPSKNEVVFDTGGDGTGAGGIHGFPGRRTESLSFRFDHVFSEGATNEDVFNAFVSSMVDHVLAGRNRAGVYCVPRFPTKKSELLCYFSLRHKSVKDNIT